MQTYLFMRLTLRDRRKIRVLYRWKDFEGLFRFVGEDKEKEFFLCLICEKWRRSSEWFRKGSKPSENLLEDVLAIYRHI